MIDIDILDKIFPEPPDDSIGWLCHCLNPTQIASIILDLKENHFEAQGDASYVQRMQRLTKFLVADMGVDDAAVLLEKMEKQRG